ncbi:hypothetical protein EMG21_34010, partial [Klebsiella pneumoniae]
RALQTLSAKRLIKEVGRAEGVGRPILYGTTEDFLQHFGLRDLKDLPPADQLVDLKDVEEEHRDLFAKKINA